MKTMKTWTEKEYTITTLIHYRCYRPLFLKISLSRQNGNY